MNKLYKDLKQAFAVAPILKHPDLPATGRNTTPTRSILLLILNYNIQIRQLLAVNVSLEKSCHWLKGAKHLFTMFMNHCNLEYLKFARQPPSDKLVRHSAQYHTGQYPLLHLQTLRTQRSSYKLPVNSTRY